MRIADRSIFSRKRSADSVLHAQVHDTAVNSLKRPAEADMAHDF